MDLFDAALIALVLIIALGVALASGRYPFRGLIWAGEAFVLLSLGKVFSAGIATATMAWLPAELGDAVPTTIAIAWWLAMAWLTVQALDVFVWRGVLAVGRRPRVPKLLTDLTAGLIYLAAVIAIVYFVFEQSVTGLLATSGVVAVVLGFALQNTLSDFFSGIALNFEGAYHEGEWISLDGQVEGEVVEVNWRATRIRQRDGNDLIVPNGAVAKSRITNFSYPDNRYAVFQWYWIDYHHPPNKVRRLIFDAVLSSDRVLKTPEPRVTVDEFGDWAARYQVKYWVRDYADHPLNRDAGTTNLLYRLHRAGIQPAVPRSELSLSRRPSLDLPDRQAAEAMLALVDVFQPLSEADREALAERMRPELFADGEALVRQGESGASLFIVADGNLAVRVRNRSGSETVVAELGPGQYFGELSLLTGAERSATVVASGDVLVYEIEKRHIEPYLTASPEVADLMSQVLAKRQLETQKASATEDPVSREAVHSHAEEIMDRIRTFFGMRSR